MLMPTQQIYSGLFLPRWASWADVAHSPTLEDTDCSSETCARSLCAPTDQLVISLPDHSTSLSSSTGDTQGP